MRITTKTEISAYPLLSRGKVRDIYDIDDKTLLIVRTDRDYTVDINDATLTFRENKNGEKFAGCILNDVHREFSLLGQLGADESGQGGNYYGYSTTYGSKYSKHDI